MGAREANFYNNLATAYGYGDAARTIQDLYLAGKKKEAEAAVPEDLMVKTALIGTEGHVRDRLRALTDSGVRTLTVRPVLASTGAEDHRDRVRLIERLRSLIDQL
jgi:alkanesulfonate monooxygenase SsuD/methylene tetrahydromethanopterin reductase-like flavin-dependent oxidoreductase (luciferase family)